MQRVNTVSLNTVDLSHKYELGHAPMVLHDINK